jgi:DnaJ family protein C protein 2
MDLFSYSEEELLGEDAVLTYYEILNVELHASQDDVKKSFRRLSLRYHPDKTQRDADDHVFRALKAAYDCLYDPAKRQAYDSTKVPFDDSIPPPGVPECQFYEVYGPVFERNLRFDARLRPEMTRRGSSSNGTTNGSRSRSSAAARPKGPPPSLGDDDTPLDRVQHFYNYWIHFDSWRDFGAQAASELQVEDHLENAESRDERRYLQREIDKRSKQLKKMEVSRLKTLVERAMEADPRLRRHRSREKERKQQQIAQKRRADEDRKLREQREQEEREILERQEKERQAEDRARRDREKKQVRKARQQLRRMASSLGAGGGGELPSPAVDGSIEPSSGDDDLTEAVESLCASLALDDLLSLNEQLEVKVAAAASVSCSVWSSNAAAKEAVELIRSKATELDRQQSDSMEAESKRSERDGEEEEEEKKEAGVEPDPASSAVPAKQPWSRDELSALAKGVKKYPAGSSNRWETIANFVNHSCCRGSSARTKEECVDKYNKIRSSTSLASTPSPSTGVSGAAAAVMPRATAPAENGSASASGSDGVPAPSSSSAWTPEQDQQLQDGLARHPATLSTNERWDRIAGGVHGKTKKECVMRFKAIRQELLDGKKSSSSSGSKP